VNKNSSTTIGFFVFYLSDDARGVLLGRSTSHRDEFAVAGVYAIQFVDDVQHIVAAALFTVGDDVDAGPGLVVDGLERGLVQQPRKLGLPQFLFEIIKRESKAVEQ
jgi:hypothetical protein